MLRNFVIGIGIVLSGPSWSYSVPAIGTTPPNTNGIPSERRNDVPAMSKKVIVSIRDEGLSNHALNLGEKEGSVFFFNDSSSENITLSIAWGNRAAHCASENLKLDQDGSLHTIRPMKRKDFSVVCFPESGEYNYVVKGLPSASRKNQNKEVDGKIIVP